MYITYHKEVEVKEGSINFPLEGLNKEVVDFLIENNSLQSQYKVWSSGYNLFIYTDGGDRIDVQL